MSYKTTRLTPVFSILMALPKAPPVPADNPMSEAKVELGKELYFDPRLSLDGTISCNSCHNVMSGGEDGRPFSAGVKGQLGGRSAPTVWNAAYLSSMFWDSRMATLEDQAKGPLTNPVEMAMTNHDLVVSRVAAMPGYAEQFKAVYGPGPITIDTIAKSIASFERTLITPNSPVDRYLNGETGALTAQQIKGMQLVQDTGCIACHSGPNYAGPALPPGTPFLQKFPTFTNNDYVAKYDLVKDGGRFEATKNPADRGLWRVPTWRNIALTAPYFHNGSVATLDEAVRVMAKTQLDKTLPEADVQAIVAFLTGLTGERPRLVMPRLPSAH